MNIRGNFPGTGMSNPKSLDDQYTDGIRQAFAEPPEADDLMSEALAEDLAEAMGDPYHLPITLGAKRNIFQRAIDKERAEKARQQAIAAAAMAKARQLTASIRSMEDALDGLLVSEVA